MQTPNGTGAEHISEELIERVVQQVRKQIGGLVPDSVLWEQTRAALVEMRGAKVQTFVPLLAAQAVLARFRESSRTWAARKVAAGADTVQVLFVCVHNSGRSVMAETLVNHLAPARGLKVQAQSAGTHPGAGVNPIVAAAMQELGFDVSGHRPQLLTEEMVRGSDYIFTMGCAVDTGSCPSIFLKGVEDWALEDPHGKPLDEVRAIREQVRRRVEALLVSLVSLTPPVGSSVSGPAR